MGRSVRRPPCHDGPVLIVDGANVVGSRPDGWWRDRAGAASRLHRRLVAASHTIGEPIVIVLEGRATAGVPAGTADGVEVVHADGSGDDAIVARVAQHAHRHLEDPQPVTVVTADRGLRRRVIAQGAAVEGPSWLLRRLDRHR